MNTPVLPTEPPEVTARKDQHDLSRALRFVAEHEDIYRERWEGLVRSASANRSPIGEHFFNKIACLNADVLTEDFPQVRLGELKHMVLSLPPVFHRLSSLHTIDYVYASTVFAPIFDERGYLTGNKAELVDVREFPRENDHQSRILIGYSSGATIFPSALPPCVWPTATARFYYQVHVMFHEFFHSIEYLRRTAEARSKIVLEYDRSIAGAAPHRPQFTFQEWWMDWEVMFTLPADSPQRPKYPSQYAAIYADDLNWRTRTNDYEAFTRAIAEQICETFVGWRLGIMPNDFGETEFKEHCPRLWRLMENLASAKIVSM